MRTIFIGCHLKKFADEQPNKVAIYEENNQITYKMFYDNVQQYKQQLFAKANGSTRQKVALLIGNESTFLEIYFAIITLGWVAIPFDPKWSKREAVRIMEDAEVDIIITNKQFNKLANYTFSNAIVLSTLQQPTKKEIDSKVDESNLFYLGFTSGSTGYPKGFIRTHGSWLTSFTVGENTFSYGTDDIIMAPGPLCHSLSLFGATHALHIGASFYITPTFSAAKTVELIENGKVTVVYAVPTMLNSLAKQKTTIQSNVTFLSSGAKLLPQIKEDLQTMFPNSILFEYYGASELSFATYSTTAISNTYPNSVGKPFPNVVITIRDNDGNILPLGEIGSIFIESPYLFSGYVNNSEATKEVLTKYGATIGDLGFLNEEGILTIVGRKNNMIITGGQNVYPEEVEKVMKDLPFVKEAVVIGISHLHWGEQVIALIEWQEENSDNLKRLKVHCREHLAIYKRPRKYYVVQNLPYTPTGKIARKEIVQHISRWTQ